MSLISDALKRTQQNTAPRPPSPRKTPLPQAPKPERARKVTPLIVLGVIALACVGVLGWWQLYGTVSTNAKALSETTALDTPRPPEAPTKPPEPVSPPPPVSNEVKDAERAAHVEPPKPPPEPVVAPTPIPPAPPPPPPPPPKELPKLVLQGVTISRGTREALINGQLVGIGEEVEGAKVISIEQAKVKLLFDGREFTLTFAR